jgi:hypothetical protein
MEPYILNQIATMVQEKTAFSLRVIIFLFSKIVHSIFHFFYGKTDTITLPTISSQCDTYIATKKSKFLESYEKYDNAVMNANIEKCFYDSKLHALAVEHADNELEQTWRRRILLENTPRGNILMYYDAYKQGFSYYSDSSSIPYFIINAVIMKYVLLYRCRDFFLDDQITPENHPSPLLPKSDKSAAEPQSKPSNVLTNNSKAFAKLKNYHSVSAKTQSSNPDKENNTKEKKYTRNKVIYAGKIANATLLQKPNVKRSKPIFSSPLLDELDANSAVQKQTFSYKDFKQLKNNTLSIPLNQVI